MPDVVAITSVVSSGLVALGGLVVNYRNGREQRSHEAQLAFQGRAWDLKSDGLFRVIAAARRLIDGVTFPVKVPHKDYALIPEVQTALDDVVPLVETYASHECRTAFDLLRQLLMWIEGPDESALAELAAIERALVTASTSMERGGPSTRAEARDHIHELWERQAAIMDAAARSWPGAEEMRPVLQAAENLIDAARDSLRG